MRYPNNEEVRAWADARYFGVPLRGRLPQWVITAWDEKHPKRKYVASEAHHGTLGGYNIHGCGCDRCVKRRREYQNTRYHALKAA